MTAAKTMLSLALLLSIITQYRNVSGYYLSLSQLKWANASNYCYNHCNSDLASIHNQQDFESIIQLIQQNAHYLNSNVYIGLNTLNDISPKYSDGTLYDYTLSGTGSNIANADCFVLNTGDYMMTNAVCGKRKHFLCNSCNGKINKYVIPNIGVEHTQSQQFCQDAYNTTLASIHNNNDMDEAQILCHQRTIQGGCWIGLYDEIGDNLQFKWDDNTIFDYGYDLTKSGVYPWSVDQPANIANVDDEHCVSMKVKDNYLWNAEVSCTSTVTNAICNMPSEICYKNNWQIITGNNWIFGTKPCELYNNYDIADNEIKLSGKQWPISYGIEYMIEYTFTMSEINNNCNGCGEAGILIYTSTPSVTSTYYIGISYAQNQIFLLKHNENWMRSETLNFQYQLSQFYTLKIIFLNNLFTVYFNGDVYVNLSYSEQNDGTIQALSFGVKNVDSSIIATSLFVSGNAEMVNITETTTSPTSNPTSNPTSKPTSDPITDLVTCGRDLKLCADGTSLGRDPNNNCEYPSCPTPEPTPKPTTHPTMVPTSNPIKPTPEPTQALFCGEEDNALVSISFNYTLKDRNISSETIINILKNVTELIDVQIIKLSLCDILDFHSNFTLIGDFKAVINASICYICDDDEILNVEDIENGLISDFIDIINNETPSILIVASNATIDVEIITDKEVSTSSPKQTVSIQNTENEKETHFSKTMNIILISVLILLLFLCIIIMIKIRKKNKRSKIKENVEISIMNTAPKATEVNILTIDGEDGEDDTGTNSMITGNISGHDDFIIDDDDGDTPIDTKRVDDNNSTDDTFIVDDEDVGIVTSGNNINNDEFIINDDQEIEGDNDIILEQVVTSGNFKQNLGDQMLGNDLMMNDIIEDISRHSSNDFIIDTPGNFQQQLGDHMIGNNLMMDDIVDDINSTPQ